MKAILCFQCIIFWCLLAFTSQSSYLVILSFIVSIRDMSYIIKFEYPELALKNQQLRVMNYEIVTSCSSLGKQHCNFDISYCGAAHFCQPVLVFQLPYVIVSIWDMSNIIKFEYQELTLKNQLLRMTICELVTSFPHQESNIVFSMYHIQVLACFYWPMQLSSYPFLLYP